MKMKHRIRLVTLDFMGTLMDLAKPVGNGYAEVGEQFGVKLCPDVIAANLGKGWYIMKQQHPNYGFHTGLGWKKWWMQLVEYTFIKSATFPIDEEKLHAISHSLCHKYEDPQEWKWCDGALEFLQLSHSRKVPLAVISNNDERLKILFERLCALHYFRFLVLSYVVGFEKPDIRIFNYTLEKARTFEDLKDLKPCEILHIGDTPDLDYVSAMEAGWNAYLISTKFKDFEKYKISKECVFSNFYEVMKVMFK